MASGAQRKCLAPEQVRSFKDNRGQGVLPPARAIGRLLDGERDLDLGAALKLARGNSATAQAVLDRHH